MALTPTMGEWKDVSKYVDYTESLSAWRDGPAAWSSARGPRLLQPRRAPRTPRSVGTGSGCRRAPVRPENLRPSPARGPACAASTPGPPSQPAPGPSAQHLQPPGKRGRGRPPKARGAREPTAQARAKKRRLEGTARAAPGPEAQPCTDSPAPPSPGPQHPARASGCCCAPDLQALGPPLDPDEPMHPGPCLLRLDGATASFPDFAPLPPRSVVGASRWFPTDALLAPLTLSEVVRMDHSYASVVQAPPPFPKLLGPLTVIPRS